MPTRESQKRYVARHPERVAQSRAKNKVLHGDVYYARQKARRAALRKPRVLIGRSESMRRYYAKNRHKWAALRSKRQSDLTKATPAWANQFFIEEIYDLARLRNKFTAIRWHVDHVIPLSNPQVCGLHVETNLAVIPAVLNLRKGNRCCEVAA